MSDTINLTDLFAGFNLTSIFEQAEETNLQQIEQTDETARPGRRRGQLRAAFAQQRGRARPAFLVDLSQRARETARGRETREADAEAAPQGRAALRQQFQQSMQAFGGANQPGRAAEGEDRRGVVTIPVGIERGTQQGGEAAAEPAQAGRPERPGFQVEAQPAAIANREPPRLDGVRMAASFEQTALGNALNLNRGTTAQIRGPASRADQGPGVGRNAVPAARLDTEGQTPPAAGRTNAPDGPGFGGGGQPAQGPLARVQSRLENPGNNLLDTDQQSPLGTDRVALQGRVGASQLEARPLVGQVNPGALGEPAGGIGENGLPAAGPTTGVALPANPLEPQQPALLNNEPAAPLDGNPGQAAPALDVLQAALEPEQPAANPPPPAPEPPETPTERAAAIRITPAEAADEELRAAVPTPIEPPPGTAAPAAPPGPAVANPAARAAGAPGEAGGPVGAPEAAQAPGTVLPAEAGAEEENGAGVTPPEAAGPAERPPAREEEGLEARATAAYEQQQMENRTNEPNERRTVTEMFIR